MAGMDYESYEWYYENGIVVLISLYSKQTADIIVSARSKEQIWNEYLRLNNHCKTFYMSSDSRLIDRHKVVACYMYAIERANVISVAESLRQGDRSQLLLNEKLAVSFGLSLLRALILDIVEELHDVELQGKLWGIFDGDISLPKCTHGDFKSNLLMQLYYTKKEGNYNVLSLAETLYMIECYNLIKAGLPEDSLRLNPDSIQEERGISGQI